MDELRFRTVAEAGADAGALLVGRETHNRGLCVRVAERQSRSQESITGPIELLYPGEGPQAEQLGRLCNRRMDRAAFLERLGALASEPVIACNALVPLNEIRRVLLAYLQASKFAPFEIQLPAGHSARVEDPGLVLVDRQTILVGKPDTDLPAPACCTYSMISMIHVRGIEYLADEPVVIPASPEEARDKTRHR